MAAITIGFSEAKNNFSKVTAEVNRTGRPITILKNNKPWVVIQPADKAFGTDTAVDFSDAYEYASVELES